MNVRSSFDLLVLLGLCLLLVLVIFVIHAPILQAFLGLCYIFFFPGYTLTTALYPRRNDLQDTGRLVISFGSSIALVPLIGMLLNYTSWGIRLESIVVSVTTFIVLCCGATYYRRSRLLPGDRFVVRLKLDPRRWTDIDRSDKMVIVIMAFAVFIAVGALFYTITKPKVGERFTEFYLLGPEGIANRYPRESVAGEPLTLIIGVANHEHHDVQYRVEAAGDISTVQIASIDLGHGETWEQSYTFALAEPGENRKVMFLLYKEDDPEPYRSLHLWITATEELSPQ